MTDDKGILIKKTSAALANINNNSNNNNINKDQRNYQAANNIY
jgi:hypothetical protein